ncbi:glutaredoxin 3 [Ectothiorhodospiraceae bacterium BW-2]|nr:glutaredoxin 3 [Ectothiorhodospiraceae bacterium BW-2]
MADIVIYTTEFCPFCVRARHLLDKKGVSYTDIAVDKQPEKRLEMEQRAGRTSVPQIFIDNFHVGGFDDMVELDMDGELDSRLGLV